MYDNVLKVLVVDDDEDDYVLIRNLLAEIGPNRFDTTWAATYGEALRAIESHGPEVCLIDYRLGEYNGVELLRETRARGLKLPVILLTAQDDHDVDLKAMRAGAADYLIKGQIDKHLLERSIRYAVEHARTLEALRASENKYRQIIETAREGVWTVDPDARTTYVNQRMAEMLGYTVEEMLGRPIVAFMDADDVAELQRRFERRRRGIAEQYECRLRRRDGTDLWVLVSTNPLYSPGDEFAGALGMVSDITERKQAEERLRHQLDFTAAITASMGEGVYALDEDGRLTFMNPAAEAALGWTEAELLGCRVHEVIHFQHADGVPRQAHDCPLLGVLTSGQTCRGEDDVFTRRDGTLLPVSYTAAPILTGGRVIGTVLAFRDITERRRAEEERERLAAIVESSDDTILSKDLDGRITSWNAGAERMYGYAAAEAVGRHVSFIVPPDRHEELSGLMERVARGERVSHLETIRVRKDGRRIDVSLSIAPMKDGSGRVVGASTIARDITERKATERELRESEERYRDLVENARDIIYTHDLEGNYMSVNSAGEQLLGYTREEARGMSQLQVVAPEYHERAREMIARKLAGKGKTVYELEVVAKDGRRLAVEVNSRLTYRDGVAVGVQGIARDVSERRELEEQLRQAQKMEAVGRLAGGVAHDFNNLLTVINGYSDITIGRLPAEDPLRSQVEEVRKAGERAAGLTRQLLAFSRKQVLRPEVIDLNEVVSEMEKMLRRLIGEDIVLRAALGPGLGSVKADPGQVEQVLMNLAVNARDAMPCGGRLTIGTENVYLDEAYAAHHVSVAPGRYVMLAVSDTGVGMDEETRARIFEPFFTTKEKGKGTGLGLSTVYGIVKQSGGNIWVYSEAGRGTTFKIYLPRVDADAREHRPAAESAEGLTGTETILLAEDDEPVRDMTRIILSDYGYRVLAAENGAAAIAIFESTEETIDLLLTDVVMPGVSGRELADRLTRLRPETKVLYMSGYTDDAIVHHGVLEEGVNFLQKPFTPDALARRVREVLGSPM
jgi:two-component system cell cycle sensor histidine kinase/response regulator CckA